MPKRPNKRDRLDPTAAFRRIALSLPGAKERAHMNHPDFRVNGRIFATLGYPDTNWGMVALTPEEQQEFVKEYPTVFKPVNGAWGRQGATLVHLDVADEETLGRAITLAWQTKARQKPASAKRRRT